MRDTGPASAASERPPIEWGEPGRERYTIREIVESTGVPASSVHHYRRLRLIPEPARTTTNQFAYDDRHITALAVVRALRRRGCTLNEIYHVMRDRGTACDLDRIEDRTPQAKLIDAAIEAFAQHGFREVSVAELCERADVARGTFYRCFDGKHALFLATARAIIERATAAFDAEVADLPPSAHAHAFARHLRPGLPVLFELAKRLTLESGPDIDDAAALFAGLARRLGQLVAPDSADDQAEQAGGLLIMMSLVHIFEQLLGAEITRR